MRLLIDAQGIAWATAHKLKHRSGRPLEVDGRATGAIYGTLRTLEYLARKIEPEEMIICWDRRADARFEIFPEYKAHRQMENLEPEQAEFRRDVMRQIEELRHLLTYLPVIQLDHTGAEADDLIGILGKFLQCEKVGIVTRDHDLYQLAHAAKDNIADHVIIGTDAEEVDLEFKPRQFLTYKVLVGDASDNISGVLGVGDKTARKLIRELGTLKAIMEAAKRADKLGRMTYAEAKAIVARNKRLMIPGSIITDSDRKSIISKYRVARLDRGIASKAELRKAFAHYKFTSLISRLSAFTMTFQPQVRIKDDKAPTKKWEPPQGYPSRSVRALRPQNDATRYTRIIRKTCDRSVNPGGRRRRRTRIVRRVERDAGQSAKATLLADAGRAGDTRGAVDVRASGGHRRRRDEQAAKVGKGRTGGSSAAGILPQREKGAAARDRATHAEQDRRSQAVFNLSGLGSDPAWVEKQSDKTLKFIQKTTRAFERDPLFVPSARDAAWIAELNEERTFEMPGWMATDGD